MWVMTLSLMVCQFTFTTVKAQDEPEYRMEIGGGLGMTTYLGDLNGNLFHKMQPRGAVVAKFKMNPRMAWGATLGYNKLKGSNAKVETWYPDLGATAYSFSTTLIDLDMRYEYNFWAYGTGQEYHGARPLTPFIALGIGLAWVKADEATLAAHLPIGLGVKWKMRPRLNLTLEWMMHFSGTDRFDGLRDPYGIRSTGLFKNTDCYSALQLSFTYDIWAKCKTCHSDKDL